MSDTADLSRFCCQNPDCPDYGKRGHGNLTSPARYGRDRALAVLHHLAEGCGIRQTGRLVGVKKDTVVRYALQAGGHARDLHDELVAFSPSDP